jgi:dihydrofolate reductase
MSPSPPLAAVIAIGRNGAIGRDNALPWTMPSDLARFRALTMGKPMIMGRRTFEAIGRPLPGRDSIVVSRRPLPGLPARVFAAGDPDAALALARARAAALGASEITLIGGAGLFAAMADHLDRLHLTIVDLRPDADTFLDRPDPYVWREVARERPVRDPRDESDCVVLTFERADHRHAHL